MNHRRALLRLLLLAVFLHTCIGLPLHEAEHLQAAMGTGPKTASAEQNDVPQPAKPAHALEHGPCAGCLAFAQPAALSGGIGLPVPQAGAGPKCPQPTAHSGICLRASTWPLAFCIARSPSSHRLMHAAPQGGRIPVGSSLSRRGGFAAAGGSVHAIRPP